MMRQAKVAAYNQVLSRHGKTFRFAQRFLDKRTQADAALAYAFCRMVDDAVDEASSTAEGRERIREIEAMLIGEIEPEPLVADFIDLSERAGFGLTPALDLLKGVESDLGLVQVKNDEELLTYCYRVAGTVGLMMASLLGTRDRNALARAVDLGIAMQLTNICRDVMEDAARGRVYLPRTRLRAHGVNDPGELLEALPSRATRSRVQSVVSDLLGVADEAYVSGQSGLAYLRFRYRLAISVAARAYQAIGHLLLLRHGGDPYYGRVRVPLIRKLAILATSLWHLLWEQTRPSRGADRILPSESDFSRLGPRLFGSLLMTKRAVQEEKLHIP